MPDIENSLNSLGRWDKGGTASGAQRRRPPLSRSARHAFALPQRAEISITQKGAIKTTEPEEYPAKRGHNQERRPSGRQAGKSQRIAVADHREAFSRTARAGQRPLPARPRRDGTKPKV